MQNSIHVTKMNPSQEEKDYQAVLYSAKMEHSM